MKIYITKWALTRGIEEAEAEVDSSGFANTVEKWPRYLSPRHYELMREDAIAHANSQRDKKIKLLEKQIKKLKEMTF